MARRAAIATWGHAASQSHRPTGGVGCWECGRVPFCHSLAKPKPPRREFFSTVSLHARFHQKLARREAFLKASLRVCRAQSASSQTLPAETCAKWPIIATWGGACRATSHTLAAKTCAKWPLLPPLRGEKLETKLLSAHVSTRNLRGEKLFKKFLSTQVSASPGCAKKEPSHTHLASHHPPLHHMPFRLPDHTPPTRPACQFVGTWPHRSVFRFVWCFDGRPSMMATRGHHDGNSLPS